MDITIRKAQLQDIADIQKMNDEINEIDATIEAMQESLENNQNEIVLVAFYKGTAAGFICGQIYHSICYSNRVQCEITELYVRENCRRKGIATMLIKQLELEFGSNNVLEVAVTTGINNLNAQKLYESCGYTHKRLTYLKKYY